MAHAAESAGNKEAAEAAFQKSVEIWGLLCKARPGHAVIVKPAGLLAAVYRRQEADAILFQLHLLRHLEIDVDILVEQTQCVQPRFQQRIEIVEFGITGQVRVDLGADVVIAVDVGFPLMPKEELTNALIVHARDRMGASGAVESAGGLLFSGGSPTVFIDRIDDAIFFLASTDAAAVEDARTQLGI